MTSARSSDDPSRAPSVRFGPWRREVRSFLELLALSGIAVTQPTLDILQKNADYFVSRRTSVPQAVVLVSLLVLVPAVVPWVIEVLCGLVVPASRRFVHAALCGVIAGVIAVEVLKRQLGLGARYLVLAGLVCAVLAAVIVLKVDIARLFLRYLAVAPVAFGVLFLFFSPVTSVLFQGDVPAAKVTVGAPKRVVMVVLDELSLESLLDGKGRIDPTVYPHLAALAGNATWYRNTTTVAPNTIEAVPAILSGSYPTDDGVPAASAYPHNIFTLLGRTYDLNVHESATHLCPDHLCPDHAVTITNGGIGTLLRDAFDQWRDFASPQKVARGKALVRRSPFTNDALANGREFVDSLKPARGPRLDFVHVLLPHRPWHYLGTGQDYGASPVAGKDASAWRSDWFAQQGRQRHLMQAQAADQLVGEIVAKLERIGAYDDSLIVLTADHGVAFTPGSPVRGVSPRNYPQIMWAPLLVKRAGQQAPVVDDRPLRSIDIVPTIADLLHVHIPWKLAGRSALGPLHPDPSPRIVKWIFNTVAPPPGSNYLTFDRATGFAQVMAARATSFSGDPRLLLYRVGSYGGLVGTTAAGKETTEPSELHGSIEDMAGFDHIDPRAHDVPWAAVHGTLDERGRHPVAVVVNGVVAATSETSGTGKTGGAEFSAMVPPQLFHRGRNRVALYEIEGVPATARLRPIALGGTRAASPGPTADPKSG